MWRQFSEWLGGMGIIVLFLAVLAPLLPGRRRCSSRSFRARSSTAADAHPGHRPAPPLYLGLTVVGDRTALASVALAGLDEQMNLFQAVAHAFSTIGPRGF